MNDTLPCILKIGDTKLVLPNGAAMRIMQALLNEDIKEYKRDYTKDQTTGNYSYVNKIVKLDYDRLCLGYLSPADYMIYIAAGEKE